MDILELNKKAWGKIGLKAASPYVKHDKYRKMFDLFCGKLPKNASVLDLGCGPGLPITKELVNRGFNVTAIDISDTMIELARKNVPNAKFIIISMTDIEFNNEFDGIISSFTMLCLDVKNFKKTAHKVSNALKKNGLFLLVLNEPPPEGHKEKESYTEIMGQKMYSRPYTENEIKDIFGKHNMEIISVEREIVVSEAYGKEDTLLVLMQKK
jgi:SAM-dependent methyltransferase